MKYCVFIVIWLMLLGFAACNSNENTEISTHALQISGTIIDIGGENDTKFRGGASIGMYIVKYEEGEVPNDFSLDGAFIQNEKFMQSAAGLVGDPFVTWDDASVVDIAAYYPYREGADIASNTLFFQIAERQDSLLDNRPAYEESDFLWATARANSAVESVHLQFEHLMTKVVLYLKTDAIIPGDLVGSTVKILGTQIGAEINLETGSLEAQGESGVITARSQKMEKDGYEIAVKAIVVPQTVKQNTELLEIQTLGGYSYFYKLPSDFTFLSGKQVTFEVNIESGECQVTVGEITDWIDVEETIVGEAIEDLPVFKLYDFYDLNGVQGMVVEVDETGQHGKVMSLDEEIFSVWCTNVVLYEENSTTDGLSNLQEILAIDPTLEYYPPLKWCYDKNQNGVTGWYLPASQEMMSVLKMYVDSPDEFNGHLEALGGSPFTLDWFGQISFYSSTLNSSGEVRAPMKSMFGDTVTSIVSQSDEGYDYYVRAFYRF